MPSNVSFSSVLGSVPDSDLPVDMASQVEPETGPGAGEEDGAGLQGVPHLQVRAAAVVRQPHGGQEGGEEGGAQTRDQAAAAAEGRQGTERVIACGRSEVFVLGAFCEFYETAQR